eukprot:gb/GEZN01011841.1/.p1 GENE.gb/GEZN01011841.1/~~gb/GEZN01011841.1/.p1  ORF type:complete len:298 (+),score=17.45 gb/GEZN01011841.1/:95-988(+)
MAAILLQLLLLCVALCLSILPKVRLCDVGETFACSSPKTKMWCQEAWCEAKNRTWMPHQGCDHQEDKFKCRDVIVFPTRLCNTVASMNRTKRHDVVFVGSLDIDRATRRNRQWVKKFAEANFTNRSVLIFTDHYQDANYTPLGPYDRTRAQWGFVPKQHPRANRNYFDFSYYETLVQSNFTLCPAGEGPWTMRFFEALMTRTIPVVQHDNHVGNRCFFTGCQVNYLYYHVDDELVYYQDWADYNYQLFLRHHTLEGLLRNGSQILTRFIKKAVGLRFKNHTNRSTSTSSKSSFGEHT